MSNYHNMIVNTKFGGITITTEVQTCALSILAKRRNAQKSTGPRTLSMSPGLATAKRFAKTSAPGNLIMQNKANLLNTQMNVSIVLTRDYENDNDFRLYENKPKTNPIKPNLQKAKMNVASVKTRDYGNKRLCRLRENKPKTNPIKPNFKGKKEKDFATKPQGRDEKTNKKC